MHELTFCLERIPIRGNEAKWFEFNDTSVTLWDPKRLESDCFGGNETTSESKFSFGSRKNYGKGAYLLVYQKKGVEVSLTGNPKPSRFLTKLFSAEKNRILPKIIIFSATTYESTIEEAFLSQN